jgi:hypothetical protein
MLRPGAMGAGGIPVNWRDGQDCGVVTSISSEDARVKFPKGVTGICSYLRTTPQPNRSSVAP